MGYSTTILLFESEHQKDWVGLIIHLAYCFPEQFIIRNPSILQKTTDYIRTYPACNAVPIIHDST